MGPDEMEKFSWACSFLSMLGGGGDECMSFFNLSVCSSSLVRSGKEGPIPKYLVSRVSSAVFLRIYIEGRRSSGG